MRHTIDQIGLGFEIAFFVAVAYVAARIIIGLVRFTVAPWAMKRNYPRAWWIKIQWRWLSRNLSLAYVDPHQKTKIRAAMGPAIGKNVRIEKTKRTKVRYPSVHVRADSYGVVVKLKTIPKVGRTELENASEHLANAWRCHRVQVSQPRPGRLIVRGLRTDPLVARFGPEGAPAGTYTHPHPFRPYLGRDEWGRDRHLDLSGITGITIGGLPGYGKTSLVLSLLHQLAGSYAVQFVLIDGKGGGDYAEWAARSWMSCGDELDQAATTLEDVHSLMRYRLANVVDLTGHRNAWNEGPTEDFPLIVTIVDECHTYYDLEAVKGEKEAEKYVRTCRTMSAQLVKKGRSVLMLTIFLTQKQTGDAIPTAIRDNCGIGLCGAVKTRDAAVAALGEAIRDYPSYCPTGLQKRPDYIGVMTASLPTGADPFVRLRVPEISEAAADQRARETAHLRSDPSTIRAALTPDLDPAGV